VEEFTERILQTSQVAMEQSLQSVLLSSVSSVSSQVWGQIKLWLPSITCFLLLLGLLITVILLLIFGPCLFNLLVKFVSSHLLF
jgi:hypothetical protein